MFKIIITNIEALKMPAKTAHFNPKIDKKLLCTCGSHNCDKRDVKQNILNRLEEVRVLANRPLTVTSGGRCPNHKNEIHRTTPADHQQGIGIDIAVSGGMERAQLVTLGLKRGFNAIGIAKTFVHLGYREGQQPVMWVY